MTKHNMGVCYIIFHTHLNTLNFSEQKKGKKEKQPLSLFTLVTINSDQECISHSKFYSLNIRNRILFSHKENSMLTCGMMRGARGLCEQQQKNRKFGLTL